MGPPSRPDDPAALPADAAPGAAKEVAVGVGADEEGDVGDEETDAEAEGVATEAQAVEGLDAEDPPERPETERFGWLPYAVLALLVLLGAASFAGTLLR